MVMNKELFVRFGSFTLQKDLSEQNITLYIYTIYISKKNE